MAVFNVSINIKNNELWIKNLKNEFKQSIFVAESGYDTATQLTALENNGFDAVLIGEGLVKSKTIQEKF